MNIGKLLGRIDTDVARADIARETVPCKVAFEALLSPPVERRVVRVSKRRIVALILRAEIEVGMGCACRCRSRVLKQPPEAWGLKHATEEADGHGELLSEAHKGKAFLEPLAGQRHLCRARRSLDATPGFADGLIGGSDARDVTRDASKRAALYLAGEHRNLHASDALRVLRW